MAVLDGLAMYDQAQPAPQVDIEQYAPLVKRIAHHMMMRMPASVQVEDLIQAGMIGLLEASTKYDASKGASFETYAGIRIRGAIVDEMRRGDWAPRSVHRNARRVQEAIQGSNTANDASCSGSGPKASLSSLAKASNIARASANHQKSARGVVPESSRPLSTPLRIAMRTDRLGVIAFASKLSVGTSKTTSSARKDSFEIFAPDSTG